MADSLIVEHHVRQPDVFGGQPDLHHPVELLRDPSQTVVLPLLRADENKMLSHSFTNQTAARHSLRGARRGRSIRRSVGGQCDTSQTT